jgi:hypothetical protein
MTKEVTGYKYQVQAAAENAQNALRVHYLGGRPQGNPNGDGKVYTTTEWVSVEFNDGASGTFYYFLGDYAPILGPAQVFDVDEEEI